MQRQSYFFLALLFIACTGNEKSITELQVPGLDEPVEVIRDENGVNHIYAQTEHDLFFAQGYCAAKDRLFQFEMWRRQASGTVAEMLGERELNRDIGARLFRFRGDLKKEFNHYHPRGETIIHAFTEGINACVKEFQENPELLPLEFQLLGVEPGYWTPDLIVSRHQGLLGNLTEELAISRAVALVGPEIVKSIRVFEPGDPDIHLDPSIDPKGLLENITELYDAFRKPITFYPEDLVAHALNNKDESARLAAMDQNAYDAIITSPERTIGSNNWIVSPSRSASGYPLLANDPHRTLSVPSLRYMVHLHGAGWNVVGGGEPTIPGISIGHNEWGAWGLTVFNIDGEDLMVYKIDPDNHYRYRYRDGWEEMTTVYDTIRVKGGPDTYVEHKYTRHGPVTFIDKNRSVAYAVRCAWLEPGGAPYLASLRMNNAQTWDEFREACSYSHIPAENMIWADAKGNIGWQVAGIAPVRKNWSGLVPVPGDGRYEWEGYLPIPSLPNVHNPKQGYWATANENLVPQGYAHRNAVGWLWADSSRANRVNEVLAKNNDLTQEDMMRLQTDYVSVPSRELIALLRQVKIEDEQLSNVRNRLLQWDNVLDKNSIEAGIYVAWERKLVENTYSLCVPESVRAHIRNVSLKRTIQWIKSDMPELNGRDAFLVRCLQEAVSFLQTNLGTDIEKWKYGQVDYHHVLIKHALSNSVNDSIRALLDCGPLPRGGNSSTPGMTGNSNNQTHGATFRMVADLADWDKTVFSNAPGQSGNVNSTFYNNLFVPWAGDAYFPVYFTKAKVESAAADRVRLVP